MKSFLVTLRDKITGARTVKLTPLSNPCPICDSTECYAAVHLNSYGVAEILVLKCPKCGEFKKLYQMQRREPRFQRLYSEWLTGAYNPPASKKEV
jgi:hypothetical protein